MELAGPGKVWREWLVAPAKLTELGQIRHLAA